MSDDRLKDGMRTGTENVVVPPLDLRGITTRGRRLRVRRTALTAAASVLVVAISVPIVMALTSSGGSDPDIQPAGIPTFPAGDDADDTTSNQIVFTGRTADGEEVTATIEVKDGKVCFDIPDARTYRAAHLHLVDADNFSSPVLATFFEPPAEPSASGCVVPEKFDEEALTSGNAPQVVDLHISKTKRVFLEPRFPFGR